MRCVRECVYCGGAKKKKKEDAEYTIDNKGGGGETHRLNDGGSHGPVI